MKVNPLPNRTRRPESLFAIATPHPTTTGVLLIVFLLLLSWNSLLGSGVLNLGYLRLTDFLLADKIVFSEVEPVCPRGLLISSDGVSLNSTEVLMSLERSMRYLQSISPYLGMGMLHLALGDSEHARRVLQTGLSVDESNFRLQTLLGCAYLQSGESDSAIAQWRNVAHFRQWRIVRGHILRLEGNWDASIRDYYAVAQVNPSSSLYHLIAWNHVKLGQITEAIVAYRKAIELGQPDDNNNYIPEMSRLELAKLYMTQEDWYDAKTELESVIAGQPALAEAYEQLGVVYYKGFNDLQFANSLLLHSIEINPNAAEPYLYLGSFNRARKEYVVAERWLEVGLALPNNMWTPWLHGELGRIYLELGRYDEAIPELKAVVDAVPTDTWYRELLGDAYRQIGKLKEAARYYQEALTFNPEHVRIKNKLTALRGIQP